MDLLPTKNPKRTNCLLQQSRQWLENTVAIVSQGTFVDTIGQAKIIFDSYSYLQLGIRSFLRIRRYMYVIRWWFYISSAGWTMKEDENSIEKNKASFWGVRWKPVFNSNTYRMPFQLCKIPVIAFEGCSSVEDGSKSPIVRSSSSLFTNLRLGSCQSPHQSDHQVHLDQIGMWVLWGFLELQPSNHYTFSDEWIQQLIDCRYMGRT